MAEGPPLASPAVADALARVAALEAELAAAHRTIEVLMDRVERPVIAAGADRFALHKTIAGLQDEVRQRTRAIEQIAGHYRALYDQSPDAVLTIDPDSRISDCNRTAERLFGRRREEVQGGTLSALLDPASAAALTTLLWSGFTGSGESAIALADGRRLSFAVAARPDEGWLIVMRDITRSHQLDQETLHERRLASVGRLAASVAAEINNPLAVIQGRLELMEAQPGAVPTAVLRQLPIIREQCGRISGLMRNLQTFAVPPSPRRQWLSVAAALAEAVDSGSSRLRLVSVQIDVSPSDLQVRADPDLLSQLLGGLLRQSKEGSPPGSHLRVTARPAEGGVRLSVHAEGGVLREELLAELRSPYCGRQVDPALGLHLAIAWAIAQDHGGWLTAENDGGSAIFHVYLPDLAADVPVADPPRRLSVLVVDDDQLLCDAVGWMLSTEGHRIVTVESGEEALERLALGNFDLVVTDYRLPGMDGEALARIIDQRWPALSGRTVLTSGLLHTPKGPWPYLQKPFTSAQLLGLVRSLEGRSSG